MDALNKPMFQLGYVTNDLEGGIATFRRDFGMGDFARIPDMEVPAPGNGSMRVHFALAWSGDVMIELIQPLGGDDAMLRDYLPTGAAVAVRHHHVGYLLPSLDMLQATEQQFRAKGIDISVQGVGMEMVHFFYADTRPQLGHYSEYVCLTDSGKEAYANLPHY